MGYGKSWKITKNDFSENSKAINVLQFNISTVYMCVIVL